MEVANLYRLCYTLGTTEMPLPHVGHTGSSLSEVPAIALHLVRSTSQRVGVMLLF